jgi:hypothetical protein
MPLLLADFIYSRDCKLNLRKNVDTTREITDMCLSVPCPAAVSALFPFVGIEKRQPFFPAVPCRQFVRFCCDKGPFCTDLKTALCSRYGANDYLSFIMIFSGATFSVI